MLVVKNSVQRLRLGDVAVFENRQPVIAAKFINKSLLFIQLLSVILRLELELSSEQKAENIFVAPPYCQTACCLLALLVSPCLYFCRTHFNLRFLFKTFSINVSPLKVNALLTSVPQIEGIELVIRLCVTTFAVSSIL